MFIRRYTLVHFVLIEYNVKDPKLYIYSNKHNWPLWVQYLLIEFIFANKMMVGNVGDGNPLIVETTVQTHCIIVITRWCIDVVPGVPVGVGEGSFSSMWIIAPHPFPTSVCAGVMGTMMEMGRGQQSWGCVTQWWSCKKKCWFIVDSTRYRRYLDMPSLMVGKFYKPASIRRDLTP